HLVQTFYVESDQPNVLFGADRIEDVYFPAGGLAVDREGTVHVPILLEEGIVYSVVSEVPDVPLGALRNLPDADAIREPALRRYLQLPDDPPRRGRELAGRT